MLQSGLRRLPTSSSTARILFRRALCASSSKCAFDSYLQEKSPLADASLRAVGQVVFCNSPLAGTAILAAITMGDGGLACLAMLGAVSGTAFAKLIGLDSSMVASGLAGYNGCLVGCAFSVFLTEASLSPTVAAATVLASCATVPVVASLKPVCGTVPQWTWAFNLTTLSVLGYIRPLEHATPPADAALTMLDWAYAPLVGVSQIFVVNSPVAGAALLAGIAWHSRQSAVHTLLGSVVGMATAIGLGAPASEMCIGLWGFNSALTALAVSVFFVPSTQSYVLATGGACATAVVFAGLKTAFGAAFAVPALTVPFCIVASGCHLLRGSVPGLVLAVSPSPEKNTPLKKD